MVRLCSAPALSVVDPASRWLNCSRARSACREPVIIPTCLCSAVMSHNRARTATPLDTTRRRLLLGAVAEELLEGFGRHGAWITSILPAYEWDSFASTLRWRCPPTAALALFVPISISFTSSSGDPPSPTAGSDSGFGGREGKLCSAIMSLRAHSICSRPTRSIKISHSALSHVRLAL
ncbi:hypothetical protein DL93DRAFT_447153 [Clavulina sp. PMI_390]|nr:hypothetical protein DL93DRAFT_447153 [Clavulina sp. PMI_390]